MSDDDHRPPLDVRFATTVAVGVAAGLLLHSLLGGIFARVRGIFVILLVSLFLSFAMEPAVQFLARRGVRRGLGTGLVFLAALMLMTGFVAAMVPLIVDQTSNLVEQGPELLDGLADRAKSLPGGLGEQLSGWIEEQRDELPSRVPSLAGTVLGGVVGLGTTVLGGILQLLTILLVTFYLVADGPRLRRTLVSRVGPEDQREMLAVWELAIAKTGGYVYSRVLTAIVSGIFHAVAFGLIGVPYAVALGIYVGIVSSLIPVIGTYLAGALPLVIALADSPTKAIWVLVVIVVYQQIENYLIAPRITAATMELHPAVAFVSVLAGGSLLGATGALLALPAAAIVAALISAYGERHEVLEHGLIEDTYPAKQKGVEPLSP